MSCPAGDAKADLAGRYLLHDLLGSGAYGLVWQATAVTPNKNETNRRFAIKRVLDVRQHHTNAKRTLREIRILRHCRHDNIVRLHDAILSSDECHVYLVLELMESDLHRVLHSSQSLTMQHVKYFFFQILRALAYLHSADIVHRDLKPSNVLVNSDCTAKLADFGMSRGASTSSSLAVTQYVATRWYRAPELLLSHSSGKSPSGALDLWSAGCILAEMIKRKTLFPGNSPLHQVEVLVRLLGCPPSEFTENINSERISHYLSLLPPIARTPILSPVDSSQGLLDKLLVWEPDKRLTAFEALNHSFLSEYTGATTIITAVERLNFVFDSHVKSTAEIHQEIKDQILSMHIKAAIKQVKPTSANENPLADYYKSIIQQMKPEEKPPSSTIEQTDALFSEIPIKDSAQPPGPQSESKSMDVKAKLRAALLSDEWRQSRNNNGSNRAGSRGRNPSQRNFRHGNRREDMHATANGRVGPDRTTTRDRPVSILSKQDQRYVSRFIRGGNQDNNLITVHIRQQNTNNGSTNANGDVVTLSIQQVPKNNQAILLVPVTAATTQSQPAVVIPQPPAASEASNTSANQQQLPSISSFARSPSVSSGTDVGEDLPSALQQSTCDSLFDEPLFSDSTYHTKDLMLSAGPLSATSTLPYDEEMECLSVKLSASSLQDDPLSPCRMSGLDPVASLDSSLLADWKDAVNMASAELKELEGQLEREFLTGDSLQEIFSS